jgi:hypothetical protein
MRLLEDTPYQITLHLGYCHPAHRLATIRVAGSQDSTMHGVHAVPH